MVVRLRARSRHRRRRARARVRPAPRIRASGRAPRIHPRTKVPLLLQVVLIVVVLVRNMPQLRRPGIINAVAHSGGRGWCGSGSPASGCARRAARASSSSACFVACDTIAAESRGAASESSVEEDIVGGGERRPFRFFFLASCRCSPLCPSASSSSSSSSSSGRRIGWRRPKRSQPKRRMLLPKRARLRRCASASAPGFECRESVSASAVVALPESTRRSSRSLRSLLEERRHARHGVVSARRESDQENDSMSFPRWRW